MPKHINAVGPRFVRPRQGSGRSAEEAQSVPHRRELPVFEYENTMIMSSDDLNSSSRGLITGFSWKMLYDWPLKVGLALLYPPLLVTTNLWRKSTDPHG
ncbi:hypothetical protein SO802_023763 [Lithocarpus litseifolius]|uniref:Uncharacterized protein n=1 Tax=Lithocarpus litseifolius TaxID=425828 RepID=A0AAW2CAL2_9ROSI